ncbi:MAG: 4Fe-4S dicluster domain-containing protein [Chloroflexota bacterium]
MSQENEFVIHKPPAELAQTQDPIELDTLEDYPYKSVALGSTRANLTGLWRYWRPYYQTKRAPCDAHCPVANHVVDFIQTMLEGHWLEAANILRAENPLPAITGRICHRPCEMHCNRRPYDQRIAIHDIESILAAVQYQPLDLPLPDRSRSVAVVGSGPAELAFAHFMALLHHQVTLFEAAADLGGRLRYGPQSRHLPDGILDAEIERIVAGRVTIQRREIKRAELETDYQVVFGSLDSPDHLSLHVSNPDSPGSGQHAGPMELLGGKDHQEPNIPIPLRVSEAIGYGKWVALLLDADWRGLDAAAVLARIQLGGNSRIVSAMKYLSLLTGHEIQRSEEIVTYDKLHLDMLDPARPIAPSEIARAQHLVGAVFASAADIQHALEEAARCFSCGRCNNCDNCWIYCPDGVISRPQGSYQIDYDYCKGCTLCAAVCPRGVISIIEEEKWSK